MRTGRCQSDPISGTQGLRTKRPPKQDLTKGLEASYAGCRDGSTKATRGFWELEDIVTHQDGDRPAD